MVESKFPGVEHLPRVIAGAFPSVDFVAKDGMAEMMEVDADLVSAAAVENALDQADLAVGTENAVFGFSGTALTARDRHSLPVNRVTCNRLINHAAARPRCPRDEREIDFPDRTSRELL
jgi:hypothetical protein